MAFDSGGLLLRRRIGIEILRLARDGLGAAVARLGGRESDNRENGGEKDASDATSERE